MSATERKIAAGSLGNLEENLKKVAEATEIVERNKSKKSGYVTLHMWVDMANMSMKGAIEMFQQIKLNTKISAEDIKATDDTIEKFTRDYEKVMKRANDIYDDMEENTKQKKVTPEERQEDAEMSQGESDHPHSNLISAIMTFYPQVILQLNSSRG